MAFIWFCFKLFHKNSPKKVALNPVSVTDTSLWNSISIWLSMENIVVSANTEPFNLLMSWLLLRIWINKWFLFLLLYGSGPAMPWCIILIFQWCRAIVPVVIFFNWVKCCNTLLYLEYDKYWKNLKASACGRILSSKTFRQNANVIFSFFK